MTDLTALPADCLFTSHDGSLYARQSTTEERIDTLRRDFDAKDKQGRQFGARVIITRETRVAKAGSYTLTKWLGSKIGVRPHALRDGRGYGASQRTHYVDTVEQAQAWADRYFRDAEKRALKNKARAS